ncbi:MAG: T9SS C-terminal target domain-containing protein [Bacteroidetes bacterium]|nr:T9SS C-terminal target domain-containing protein [Bacteroidota bacterium]
MIHLINPFTQVFTNTKNSIYPPMKPLKLLNRISILLTLTFLVMQPAAAQDWTYPCGTGDAPRANLDYISQLRANGVFDHLNVEQVGNTIFLPVKFHVIGSNTGTGYFTHEGIFRNLCELNQKYNSLGIQFFMRGDINYIPNSSMTNLPSFEAAGVLNTQHNVARVINIYYTGLSALSLCGFANFPGTGEPQSPSNRQGAIYLSPSCSGAGNSTWTHEMGHFLNLPHPFQNTSEAPQQHERVTRITETPPRLSANCADAGDRFCDTEADFRGDRWNCPGFNSTVRDINQDLFLPNGTLYMSYSDDNCQTTFSPEQIAAMRATLTFTPGPGGSTVPGPRMYLLSPPMPAYDTIIGTANVVEPANNSTGHPANWVVFRWNRVPGATMYALRIRRNFTLMEEILVNSADTVYTYTGTKLSANVPYRISVMPLNHKVTCRPYSTEITFTTTTPFGVGIDEESAQSWNVYPSLLQSDADLHLQFATRSTDPVDIRLTDGMGRLVRAETMNMDDNGLIRLNSGGLPNGLYLLSAQTGAQTYTRRVVVNR